MTPREKRDRLFKKSRPHIRPLEPKDMGWLWAAYKSGSFQFPADLTQEAFAQYMTAALNGTAHYMVEDDSRKFKTGFGPVGLVGIAAAGEKIEPAAAVFKWATPKNILRGYVAFFQWIKSQNIEECQVRAPAKDKLMQRVCDYGAVRPRAMETVYGVRGRKK
jgi:hypothetical protein